MGQAAAPRGPGTQPLGLVTQATADSVGNAVFTFPRTPTGLIWTGTCFVPEAPAGAIFFPRVNQTGWGPWSGWSVAGPFQSKEMEAFNVHAQGLTPGETYSMGWNGSSDEVGSVAPVWPDPSASVNVAIAGGSMCCQTATIHFIFGSTPTPIVMTFVQGPASSTMIMAAGGTFNGYPCAYTGTIDPLLNATGGKLSIFVPLAGTWIEFAVDATGHISALALAFNPVAFAFEFSAPLQVGATSNGASLLGFGLSPAPAVTGFDGSMYTDSAGAIFVEAAGVWVAH